MDEIIKENGVSKDQYISEALDFYKRLAIAFAKASQLVSDSSMEVNEEFDQRVDEGEGWSFESNPCFG